LLAPIRIVTLDGLLPIYVLFLRETATLIPSFKLSLQKSYIVILKREALICRAKTGAVPPVQHNNVAMETMLVY
jgi:hypothetical protein